MGLLTPPSVLYYSDSTPVNAITYTIPSYHLEQPGRKDLIAACVGID